MVGRGEEALGVSFGPYASPRPILVGMLVGLRLVPRGSQLRVGVVVVGAIVCVGMGLGLVDRAAISRVVAVRMAVPVHVGVAMPVRMGMAVHQVAMAMGMGMHVFVIVGVLVVMLMGVLTPARGCSLPVRMLV